MVVLPSPVPSPSGPRPIPRWMLRALRGRALNGVLLFGLAVGGLLAGAPSSGARRAPEPPGYLENIQAPTPIPVQHASYGSPLWTYGLVAAVSVVCTVATLHAVEQWVMRWRLSSNGSPDPAGDLDLLVF